MASLTPPPPKTNDNEERMDYLSSLHAQEDKEKAELMEKLSEVLGVDVTPTPKFPFEKLYFNGEMLQKYEPCMDAFQTVVDTDGEDDDAWKTFEQLFGKFLDFSWCSNWDGKRYDLVIYGVSGYTGYLSTEYLKRVALKRNPEKFTFALAGRTASKVAAMRDRQFMGTPWEDTPILAASYDDPVTMIDLARSARCIYNVAGPYLLTPGEIMLDACCFAGTHYTDINGELPWMVRSLELHERAMECGAIISQACAAAGGISDILTAVNAEDMRKRTGEELDYMQVGWMNGGTGGGSSGGTLATRNAMSTGGDEIRKIMADAYALGGYIPDRDRNGLKECTIKAGTGECILKNRKGDADAALAKMKEDPYNDAILLPQVYAYLDTRVVRKTNAWLADTTGKPHGRNMTYQEFTFVPKAFMQMANDAGVDMNQGNAGAGGAAAEKEALEQAGKYYGQGEGPSLEDLGDTWTAWLTMGVSKSGEITRHSCIGKDGYFETARVAIESAFTMVFDYDELNTKGGVVCCGGIGYEHTFRRLINSGVKYSAGKWHEGADFAPPEY